MINERKHDQDETRAGKPLVGERLEVDRLVSAGGRPFSEPLASDRPTRPLRVTATLGRGLVVVILAGIGLSGCSSSDSPSGGPAAMQAQPSASVSTSADPSDKVPPQNTPGATPDADNAQPTGTPAPPLPNAVTTPIAKVVRGGQPTQQSIKASADASTFTDTVSYSDGVTLKVTKARKAAEDGHGPGVFPGREYVAFDVEVTNASSTALDLSQVVVSAYYGDGKQLAPAVYTASAQTSDFTGTIQSGAKATASYGFAVPTSELGNVTMVVDFDGAHASAVYSGKVQLS